jgi:hypothetical protein
VSVRCGCRIPLACLALIALPAPAAAQLVVHRPASGLEADAAPPLDRGIGIVFFLSDIDPGRRPSPDSLAVLADTTARAAQVGAFLRWEHEPGLSWEYGVAATDSLSPNLVEFGYEISGVPLDTLSADRRWARLLLGYDRGGRMRRGWARLDPRTAGVELWRESLAERGRLFFVDTMPPLLFDRPDGRALPRAAPADGARAFGVYPEEVRGDWMRVRIQEPDDHCGEVVPRPRITYAWVRFLDAAGRPRLWFHSRGC